jgi:hypothetical protein
MHSNIRALACIVTLSVAMTGAGVVRSVAQTTTATQPSATKTSTGTTARRHHSAPGRNVGPGSTITGVTSDDPRGNANAGDGRVPGAPAAGSSGLGGH